MEARKDRVGYMVKYKNRDKWIGPYIGKCKAYDEDELVYNNLGNAETEEEYVKMMTKKATKIVKVWVAIMIHEIDEVYEKNWLKFFKK